MGQVMDKSISIEEFPPGEFLQEFMEGKSWTQDDLAAVLGCTRQHVNRLLLGRTAITPDTALALADAFGTSADLWMNLQVAFELALSAKKNRDVARRAAVYSKAPIREMAKRGWITASKDIEELETTVCGFLGVRDISEEPQYAIAARKGTSYEVDTGPQVAWYCRSRQLAESAPAAEYKESRLEDGISELLKLAANAEDVRCVPKALAKLGIRFVINKHLSGTKIDAAAFWLSPSQPAISVSLRHGRIDNFWFNLMHELVHIKYRDAAPVDSDLDGSSGYSDLSEIEARANREAASYLLPFEKVDSFISRNKPFFYQRKVVQFAQRHERHPGIAVGQLQHHPDGLEPNQLRKLLVNIRDYVIGQAVTDGWGNSPQV